MTQNYEVIKELNDIFELTKYARIFFCIFWRQVHSSVEARSILVTTLDFFSTLFDSFCSSDKSSWPPNDIPYGSHLNVVGISRAEIGKNIQKFFGVVYFSSKQCCQRFMKIFTKILEFSCQGSMLSHSITTSQFCVITFWQIISYD